eukprot:433666_1
MLLWIYKLIRMVMGIVLLSNLNLIDQSQWDKLINSINIINTNDMESLLLNTLNTWTNSPHLMEHSIIMKILLLRNCPFVDCVIQQCIIILEVKKDNKCIDNCTGHQCIIEAN